MPQTCICAEKCETGAVNESCPVCLNNRNFCIGEEKESEPEIEAEPEQPKGSKGTKCLFLLFLLTLFAGGGAFYYFKFIKPKDTAKGSPDFSDFDFDEDGDEESGYEDGADPDSYREDTDSTGGRRGRYRKQTQTPGKQHLRKIRGTMYDMVYRQPL